MGGRSPASNGQVWVTHIFADTLMLQFRLVNSNIITFCHEFQRRKAKIFPKMDMSTNKDWQTDLNKFGLQFVVNEWSKMKMVQINSFLCFRYDLNEKYFL